MFFIVPNIKEKIQQELANWRGGLLPGLTTFGLVALLRILGGLQPLELLAFDTFLRLRPSEPIDERIVIIGIDEEDINKVGYPISDAELAQLLRTLENYSPRVIGLDIFRNLPVEPGHLELVKTFKENQNIITIDKVLSDTIAPPSELPPEQVAFVDAVLDNDGHLRRSLLGTPTPQGYKLSLSIRLAEIYLNAEGFELGNGTRNPEAMSFGFVELPSLVPNSGSYIAADTGGVQVLLNFRAGQEPFRSLTLKDISTGNFNPAWIENRIILIGMTAPSVKDVINTSAIQPSKLGSGVIYGVEVQAHAISQIISAVLEKRPLLRIWSDGYEYLWILIWAVVGVVLSRRINSPLKNLLNVSITSILLILITYLFLILGWWIPLIPSALVLTINGFCLFSFCQYDRNLKGKISERQLIIDNTFDAIHNQPLQTLASLIRTTKEESISQEKLVSSLELLNQELREIYISIKKDNLTQKDSLYLGKSKELDLQAPIHELLYMVYHQTLERDFPCFDTLKVKVYKFDPIHSQHLTISQKRGLCRFLEEALCNVGKYAVGVTRLNVTCIQQDGNYKLSIIDNGIGITTKKESKGTQQAKNLAKQLKGKFERYPLSKRGTVCELTWKIPNLKTFNL